MKHSTQNSATTLKPVSMSRKVRPRKRVAALHDLRSGVITNQDRGTSDPFHETEFSLVSGYAE